MMHLVRNSWVMVQDNRRPYLAINLTFYGLVLFFMIYAAFNQPLQRDLINAVGQSFMTGPLSIVKSAYMNAEVLKAIALTFSVNLFIGALITITLPSLIIPFSGLLMGFIRATLWGLILSPANPDLRLVMIPHTITLLLEGQAYILAMLAAYIQGRAFLEPGTIAIVGRWKGYLEGLRRTVRIYLLVIITLVIAAVYEVIEVVLIMKFFS
ncbi:MAG: hypothetical protein MUP03_04125 [Anaerolineales bacterium]|nr:hypothetical protein [Anaerolineales bacterium]